MGKITLDIDELFKSGKSLGDILNEVDSTVEAEYEKAADAAKEQSVIEDLKKVCIENLVELHTLTAGAAPDEVETAEIKKLVEKMSHNKEEHKHRYDKDISLSWDDFLDKYFKI